MIECHYCKTGAVQFRAVNVNLTGDMIFCCESCYSKYFIDNFEELDKQLSRQKLCECGKDKHGFACHTDWCPKYVV